MTQPKLSRRMVIASGVLSGAGFGAAPAFAQTREVEGGIGGTGIVGVLTGIGSLYINGSYVTTDARTVYTDGFGAISQADLRVGHSLTVEAAGAQSALNAARVHVTHPVVGRISAIEPSGTVIRVNGVAINLRAPLREFSINDRVAVSGLWRGQVVEASALHPARNDLDLVSGTVSRGFGRVQIGAVEVTGQGVLQARMDGFATAVGTFNGARLVARRIGGDRFTGAAGPLKRLSVEGYLETTARAPMVRVAGLGHSFERTVRFRDGVGQNGEQRLLLSGAYTGKFAVQRAVILPEDADARRDVLRALLSQK